MLYVTNQAGELLLSTNAYGLANKTVVYPELEKLGYELGSLLFYDQEKYYEVFPDRKSKSELEVINAKIDYIMMLAESGVL